MLVIVTYDVSTITPAGQKRLRRVAKACQRYGQRVQKSVFECQLTDMEFEQLERDLLAEIDEETDNLRFYRLPDAHRPRIKEYGVFRSIDFDGPLIA